MLLLLKLAEVSISTPQTVFSLSVLNSLMHVGFKTLYELFYQDSIKQVTDDRNFREVAEIEFPSI